MIFYKNVDICDLPSILEKGILSIDESKNDNWENGKRAKNSTDRVYLFQPIVGKPNSFPRSYGIALLEVEIDDFQKSEMSEIDVHRKDYIEYTTNRVEPDKIKAIYIPKIFKKRLLGIETAKDFCGNFYCCRENGIDENVIPYVTWCDISAYFYSENGYIQATQEVLEQFARTAGLECSSNDDFFRGLKSKTSGKIIDLYDVMYDLNKSREEILEEDYEYDYEQEM